MRPHRANIHASCVAIGRKGVLLLGESGSGKSDIVLRLIDAGATLVADDRTILWVKKGGLYATAPATIRGLLEIRGIGIVKMASRASVRVGLVVKLAGEGARLPQTRFYSPPAPLKLKAMPPQLAFDAHFASTPAKIRAALAYSKNISQDNFHLKSKAKRRISLSPAKRFASVRRRSTEEI